MALTPVRKWLNIGFGLVLAVFAAVILWPLIGRPIELRAFCAELPIGSSSSTIRDLAQQRGFKVSPQNNGSAHVYDLQSLGKFSCTLRLNGDRLAGASFAYSDPD